MITFKELPSLDDAGVALNKAIAVYLAALIAENAEDDLTAEDFEEYCNDRLDEAAEENWFGKEVAAEMRKLVR